MTIPTNKEQTQLLKLGQSWSEQVDSITHDLATPMFCIRANLSQIEKTLPTIENNMNNDAAVKGELKKITDERLPEIKNFLNSITDFLNLLHPWNQKILNAAKSKASFEIKNCVEEALRKHMVENEAQPVKVQFECKTNFKFNVDFVFIEQAINLILHRILPAPESTKKDNVEFWTDTTENFDMLYIKSSENIMTQQEIDYFLNRYFTEKKDLGMAYCRLALLQAGGELTGESVMDEFTQFVMKFPKPKVQ